MKKRCVVFVVAVVGVLSLSAAARADLFEDALAALTGDHLEAARFDRFGQALRGGLAVGYPTTSGAAPLHGFNISTPCGSFSFGDGLIDNLSGMLDPGQAVGSMVSGLQQSVQNLIGAAISSLPMVTACYAGPTLCDVSKHIQELTNGIFQGKVLSCQQAETLLAGVGAKLSGARTSRCISSQQRGGKTLAAAEDACKTGSAGGIVHPATGSPASSAPLIGGSLDRVSAPQDIKDFARDTLGEVELSQGGSSNEPLDVDITAPAKRLHDLYRTERGQLSAKLDDAVQIVGAGNTLTSAKHQDVSLPGLAMPHGVLQGLNDIRRVDPAAYASYRDKLAGTFTMLGLSWRINELRDLLEEGMLDNTELSEAEEDIIKARLARLERERDRFIGEKELTERHALPVLQAILVDARQRQRAAGGVMVAAGVDTATPDNQFGAQHPMGYGY